MQHQLLRLGMAYDVVPDDQVLSRARDVAESIASYANEGVRSVKATIRGLAGLKDPEA